MLYLIPYPWYMDSLPMVFWPLYPLYIKPPYQWYFDSPTHGISNPLPMVYWTPYSWYIEPTTHGISNPLSMIYRIMVFCPPTHDILNYGILSLYLLTIETPAYLMIRNKGVQNTIGVQFTIQGQFSKRVLSISWMKFDPYIMGFKVPYDTGVKISPKMMECHW